MEISLSVRGLTKSFGVVRALDGVDLDLRGGEVHGLLGANGAGKSTLVKILSGVTAPDAGFVEVVGNRFAQITMKESFAAGIRVAHQELAVVPTLTVADHLLLGRGVNRKKKDHYLDSCAELLHEWGVDVPLSMLMRDIPPALQASVALVRTLEGDGRVLVLDEPTASLGPKEVAGLFHIVRRRISEGAGVLFVSHRLHEVKELCTSVTVMRNGKRVTSCPTSGMREEDLEELITSGLNAGSGSPNLSVETRRTPFTYELGSAVGPAGAVASRPEGKIGEPRGLGQGDHRRAERLLAVEKMRLHGHVTSVSLDLFKGEVLGLAGLVGAGRTEVLEALVGLRPLVAGSILLDGIDYEPRHPYEAMQQGVALVPEERATQALFLKRDIGFNLSSARLRSQGRGRRGWRTAHDAYDQTSRELIASLGIKTSGLRAPISSLSGGNQQKVVLGRFMLQGLRVLLLDEPTRGVDVGARRDFRRIIRELADRGLGIIYVTSELSELDQCDRIVVMVQGETTVEAPTGANFDEEELTRLCFRTRVSTDAK